MDGETKSQWTISIIGSIIGGLVVFLLLKSTFESQERALRMQLQQQMTYGQQQQQQSSLSPSYSSYKNNEKWAIIRNKEGYISNIEIIRDAKIGEQ